MAIDQYGQIIRRSPKPISIQTNTNIGSYHGYNSYSPNLWERFNDFIGGIGNWFADYSEQITGVLSIFLLICLAIPFIIWLFSLGLFWGIVAGVFLGGIAYYAAMIVVGIFAFISNIALGIIRYIFYSGVSFLISLLIIGGLIGYSYFENSKQTINTYPSVENTTIATKKYYCNVKSLNVRSLPDENAYIIGKLKRNQIIDVLEISNGFAKIKYDSSFGYISERYIKESY